MTVRRHAAAEGTRITADRLARYNIIATFPDMKAARVAIEALGTGGVDADHISLTGPAAERAAEPEQAQAARATTREIDTRMTRHLAAVIGLWTLGGVVVGAILGVPLTLLVLAILDAEFTAGRLVAGVFLTALSVGIAAWLVPHGSYPLQATQSWELTFAESARGAVFVGVHTQRRDEMERARHLLESKEPREVFQLDRWGRRI